MRGAYSLAERPPGAPEWSCAPLARISYYSLADMGLEGPSRAMTSWNAPVLFLPIWIVACVAGGVGCATWMVASTFGDRRAGRHRAANGLVIATGVVLFVAIVAWRASRLELRVWLLPWIGSASAAVAVCEGSVWIEIREPIPAGAFEISAWDEEEYRSILKSSTDQQRLGIRMRIAPHVRVRTWWFVLGAVLQFAWAVRRRLRRPGAGFCQACGYDLTKNESGICPECGVEIERAVVIGAE